jgi:hypothetical protein
MSLQYADIVKRRWIRKRLSRCYDTPKQMRPGTLEQFQRRLHKDWMAFIRERMPAEPAVKWTRRRGGVSQGFYTQHPRDHVHPTFHDESKKAK